MDEDRIDLSALDPGRDPDRWGAVFDRTVARVGTVLRDRERQQDPLLTIAGWTRPLLAAAAVVVVLLVPVELALERRESRAEQVRRLASLSEEWASGAREPTGADLLRVLDPGEER